MSVKYISPWVYTTKRCNLACPYCYVKQSNNDMSEITYNQILKKFDDLLQTEYEYCVFRIAGGEPMIVFDKWAKHFEKFKEAHNENSFISLITNMTIPLTKGHIEYFKRNKIGFGISLDGYSYSKPYHSGGSSADAVKANIDILLENGITNNIDISTVIDKNSFDDVELLARWIAERNLNWGIYLDHYFCGEIEKNIITDKIKIIVDVLSEYDFDIYNKLKFSNIKLTSQYEGCTAGEKLITIDTDGSIYPCQTLTEETPICTIDGLSTERLKAQKSYKIGYNYELPDKCQDCAISSMCGGGCKIHNKEINRKYTCDILKEVLLMMAEKSIERMVG